VNGIFARKAERRSRPRAALQWVVHVSREGSKHPVAAKTRNVSSQGFYCLVQEPFALGERVECTLVIPMPKSVKPDEVLWLKCQARVLRVEAVAADTAFGIAFQIEEYCVVHLNTMHISPAEPS
jgi:PilZ domain